jgi:hypothetical protein
MLIEFTVGNYRSFKEPQTLSMLAAPLKSKDAQVDANNVIKTDGQPDLLTSAAVYGANASGKSNLINAFRFMVQFVMLSQSETRRKGGIAVEPFRLNPASAVGPSHFEIVLAHKGVRYRYGFEVNKERVLAEWLYTATSSRESRLFERDSDKIVVGNRFTEGRKLTGQTRPNALFLSVVAQFNGPTAQAILDWFGNLGIGSGLTDLAMMFYTTERFQEGDKSEAIRRLICQLDLGIADLQIEKMPRGEPEFTDGMPDELMKVLRVLVDDSEVEEATIRTVHTIYDDDGRPVGQEVFDLDDHESEGTQKLFALASPVLEALEEGGVLIIDELDARLHPLMTREIVRLFNNRQTNSHGAQLIFSTQDTNLLDNELFRRDQIWFVEKNNQGASQLYSLAEIQGVRNDLSYERGYIQGRFGAVPYLNPNKLQALLAESDGERA